MEKRVRYSIVIRPNEDIIGRVKEMKGALKKAIGVFFNSVNSQAHITLFEFHAYERDFPTLLMEFRRVVEGLQVGKIELNGFNHFPKNLAFYIQPTNKSSLAIIERCNQFKKECNSKLLKNFTEDWKELFSRPHMSIGRKLQPEWIDIAYSLFTEFEAKFQWESIAIRKFNDERMQFDVIEVLPMLGKGFSSDVQLKMF